MIIKKTPNLSRGVNKMLCIVLHSTEGNFNGAVSWLTNPRSKASCHYVVSKMGEIVKLASDTQITWHAGRSKWVNPKTKVSYKNINNISIGIEQEHFDQKDNWSELQIKTVAELCANLMKLHPSIVEITKHRNIAPGRKIDPYNYPDKMFQDYLQEFKKDIKQKYVKIIINDREFKISARIVKGQVVAKTRNLLSLNEEISVKDFILNCIDKKAIIKFDNKQKKLYIYSKIITKEN